MADSCGIVRLKITPFLDDIDRLIIIFFLLEVRQFVPLDVSPLLKCTFFHSLLGNHGFLRGYPSTTFPPTFLPIPCLPYSSGAAVPNQLEVFTSVQGGGGLKRNIICGDQEKHQGSPAPAFLFHSSGLPVLVCPISLPLSVFSLSLTVDGSGGVINRWCPMCISSPVVLFLLLCSSLSQSQLSALLGQWYVHPCQQKRESLSQPGHTHTHTTFLNEAASR